MFGNFQINHIPALFTACAQLLGTVWPLFDSTRGIILHYGLPARVAEVPETWPVWHAGNARTACLGILMFIFYAQRKYEVLDTIIVVSMVYLGIADFLVLSSQGVVLYGLFRLFMAGLFGAMGLAGVTQRGRR